jgi:hypothetical protein
MSDDQLQLVAKAPGLLTKAVYDGRHALNKPNPLGGIVTFKNHNELVRNTWGLVHIRSERAGELRGQSARHLPFVARSHLLQ